MRDRIKKTDDAASVDRAQELVAKLNASGMFEGYACQEIVTAMIAVVAKAIHDQTDLSPAACFQVISRSADNMIERELEVGVAAKAWKVVDDH